MQVTCRHTYVFNGPTCCLMSQWTGPGSLTSQELIDTPSQTQYYYYYIEVLQTIRRNLLACSILHVHAAFRPLFLSFMVAAEAGIFITAIFVTEVGNGWKRMETVRMFIKLQIHELLVRLVCQPCILLSFCVFL